MPKRGGASALELRRNVPEWMFYLARRLPDETPHADDDFFDDGTVDSAWSELTVTGTHTVTESRGVLSVVFDDQSSADYNALLKSMTPSSAPVTIETRLQLVGDFEANNVVGIVFSDGTTSTDNIAAVDVNFPGTNETINVRNGTFTAIGNDSNATINARATAAIYLRLGWTATNTFVANISTDGVTWTRLSTTAMTRTLTPTHFGLTWTKWGATNPAVATFDYFRVYESDETV